MVHGMGLVLICREKAATPKAFGARTRKKSMVEGLGSWNWSDGKDRFDAV
jgi:hypothetical protein